jgi:hypothetical protein
LVLFVCTIAGILMAEDAARQARLVTMPTPFPGMDPYLEGSLWTIFHFAFGAEIVRQAVYDLLGSDLAIDYTRPPEVPLEAESALVAESLLRAAGLRSA